MPRAPRRRDDGPEATLEGEAGAADRAAAIAPGTGGTGQALPRLRLVRRPGQGDVDLVPHSKGGGVVSGWELKESAEHANG